MWPRNTRRIRAESARVSPGKQTARAPVSSRFGACKSACQGAGRVAPRARSYLRRGTLPLRPPSRVVRFAFHVRPATSRDVAAFAAQREALFRELGTLAPGAGAERLDAAVRAAFAASVERGV